MREPGAELSRHAVRRVGQAQKDAAQRGWRVGQAQDDGAERCAEALRRIAAGLRSPTVGNHRAAPKLLSEERGAALRT